MFNSRRDERRIRGSVAHPCRRGTHSAQISSEYAPTRQNDRWSRHRCGVRVGTGLRTTRFVRRWPSKVDRNLGQAVLFQHLFSTSSLGASTLSHTTQIFTIFAGHSRSGADHHCGDVLDQLVSNLVTRLIYAQTRQRRCRDRSSEDSENGCTTMDRAAEVDRFRRTTLPRFGHALA